MDGYIPFRIPVHLGILSQLGLKYNISAYYKMKYHTCELCAYTTDHVSKYTRHMASAKHIKHAECMHMSQETATPDKTDDLIAQIAELTKMLEKRDTLITALSAENETLKLSIHTCSQNIPNPVIQSATLTHKMPKTTCNTTYIADQMNQFSDSEIPTFDEYFKNGNDYVDFDFNDITDLAMFDTPNVIKGLCDFVKTNMDKLPIKYKKSSWYVKDEAGWKKESIMEHNKGTAPDSIKYQHERIVSRLLFIYQTRFIRHFNATLGDNWQLKENSEFPRIYSTVLDRANYRNSNILLPLASCFENI